MAARGWRARPDACFGLVCGFGGPRAGSGPRVDQMSSHMASSRTNTFYGRVYRAAAPLPAFGAHGALRTVDFLLKFGPISLIWDNFYLGRTVAAQRGAAMWQSLQAEASFRELATGLLRPSARDHRNGRPSTPKGGWPGGRGVSTSKIEFP